MYNMGRKMSTNRLERIEQGCTQRNSNLEVLDVLNEGKTLF